jgi:predicted nucleotidyltransferase
VEETIRHKLKELEEEFGVEVLYACESGSRAWGFPSPNSDYDVRFIYKMPPGGYLSIKEVKDNITLPITDEFDFSGWDIRKALQLMSKSNGSLFEWMQSPIIYRNNESFFEGFKKLSENYFSPMPVMYHYLSMAKKHYDFCLEPEVKLKHYFYALRTTLACEWIVKCGGMPPVQLNHLLALMEERPQLLELIEAMLLVKGEEGEAQEISRQQELNDYMINTIEWCDEQAKYLVKQEIEYEPLNAFFRQVVLAEDEA